jgi:hypothetical protein
VIGFVYCKMHCNNHVTMNLPCQHRTIAAQLRSYDLVPLLLRSVKLHKPANSANALQITAEQVQI